MLGGAFVAYEDGAVQAALEHAFHEGMPSALVTVRGMAYTIESLAGGRPMQISVQDPSKRRPVRRVAA